MGLILTIYWMAVIFSKAVGASLAQFGLLLGIFLQNYSEATLFSAGGMGLLQMVLIGYAAYHCRALNTHVQDYRYGFVR